MTELRTTTERIADTRALLAGDPSGWLATASPEGVPHIIAVSAHWMPDTLLMATRADSPTARNLRATGTGRLAFGTPDDAVLIEVSVADARPAGASSGELGASFVAAMGWDPADEGAWDYFVLRPVRVQAYRGYGEREGGTVMRDGRWLG